MSDPRRVLYRFEAAGLPGTHLEVRGMRVVEALNDPYRAEVSIVLDDADADTTEIMGRDCTLEIGRGHDVRRVVGLARHVEEATDQSSGAATVVVVPALWMLGLRRNTRMFQGQSAVEILEDVLGAGLGPYGRSHTLELNGSYATREYCIQYEETDLDFVHRLMEEEGISYAFDHEGDKELLILRDLNKSFPEVASGAAVPYVPHDFDITDVQPVNRFIQHLTHTTTSVVVNDWDWTRGTMPFDAESRSTDPEGRDRESYEHGEGKGVTIWSYSPNAYGAEDSTHQTKIRGQLHNRDRIVCKGVGRVVGFSPGNVFELGGHPNVGLDKKYLITSVEHVSRQLEDVVKGAGRGDPYTNRFECIPLEAEYRPNRRTPKPVIPAIQTAVVTGPAGEEIHTDEHGRIKVHFHWDRENGFDENSSLWIRVQQPWAGAGWGFWYLPRIGMEVVVHFVDGDPDRPLVSGCVYNGTNLPPYPLPDEKTKSTIKSNSTIGGGGSNEFRYEDKKGEEEIYTHAQKDYNEVVENDHNTLVHHDQTNTVDNNQTQIVHNDQTEMVHGNQTMTVDGNRTVHVKTNYDETVDGTETRHVVGNVSETFSSNETRTVTGNLTETIGGNETRTIGASQSESITGNLDLAIAGSSTHTIGASLSQTVTSGITVTTPAAYSITAVGGLNLTAAAGVTLTAPGGITIAAPGGVTKVDSVFDWKGVTKLSVGGFSSGFTLLKDSITGVAYSATGIKIGYTGLTLDVKGHEVKTKGLALSIYASDLKAGALDVWQGFKMML